MRVVSQNTNLGWLDARYPDELVFAFNPLYIELNFASQDVAKVRIDVAEQGITNPTVRSIEVALYAGKAKVYYSRIVELFFDDVKHQRTKKIEIHVVDDSEDYEFQRQITLLSFSNLVIWGALAIGERFDNVGLWKYNRQKPYLERTRVWFRKFPFTLTLFSKDKPIWNGIKARCDGHPYDASLYTTPLTFDLLQENEENMEVQGTVDTPLASGQIPEEIIYFSDYGKFCAMSDEGYIGDEWPANPPFTRGSEDYNQNGKARTDKIWGYNGDGKFYRHEKENNRLVVVPCGNCIMEGLFEINPADTFPAALYEVTYKQEAPQGTPRLAVFDDTFDYTFLTPSEYTTITHLKINTDTAGYYLRWIDRVGCFQYYLFTKGETTIKNKLSGNTLSEWEAYDGMWFPNHIHDISISATDTRKCSANGLTDDIFAYVSSVLTSPIIDLYIGKAKNGEDIWVPVTIVAGSYKHKERNVLHNLEISFTMPDPQAQNL